MKSLQLLVMYLERQTILLRGTFKESSICCSANTVKHRSLKSPYVTYRKDRFVALKIGTGNRGKSSH